MHFHLIAVEIKLKKASNERIENNCNTERKGNSEGA